MHRTAGLTGSWRLFRSALVPVESPGCQRHLQLAWTSTNSRSEPYKPSRHPLIPMPRIRILPGTASIGAAVATHTLVFSTCRRFLV
jgi:hypothetical protein